MRTPPTDGVAYNDVTPRWSAVWDVFGDGKTSIKWNMGKYSTRPTLAASTPMRTRRRERSTNSNASGLTGTAIGSLIAI